MKTLTSAPSNRHHIQSPDSHDLLVYLFPLFSATSTARHMTSSPPPTNLPACYFGSHPLVNHISDTTQNTSPRADQVRAHKPTNQSTLIDRRPHIQYSSPRCTVASWMWNRFASESWYGSQGTGMEWYAGELSWRCWWIT
ncbi:hypothetical protein EX30DRAFT_129684 [Ascodesmis nigricans]|uniref:Uncharacterized protein n=1 Tax=Ascodesmis nigricans TaxID=341454 RepID=A0A4S2MRN2_9PEZI|nr:hypothetical protein EX30DRAFT_129684 [Ascodesmis nigricans]